MAVHRLTASAPLRAVLLDALGTLVALEPPAPRLRDELRARFGFAVSDAQAQRAIRAEMAYYRGHLNEGRDLASLAALRRRCAEVLWRELAVVSGAGAPPLDALVDTLMSSLSFRAYDDAPEALAALKKLGLVLVVVSNWDISLPDVLARVGLADYMDGVITSAEAGARKPERAVFERGLELAGVRADQAVHVGDSRTEDVAGARAAGIAAVLVSRSGEEELDGDDVVRIGSLLELPGLLREPR